MNFKFLEVKDNELLEKVFAFRYNIIKETEAFQDYFHETNFIDDKESDIFDPYSVEFVVLDEHENICATVRLIHNSPHGYPTENCMIFDNSAFEREKLGEISRIFIDKKYRNLQTTKKIIHHLNELLYIKMIELGIAYTYGAMEASFIRLLKIYKMNYEILAQKQMHGKMGLRHPCILYTKKLGDDNIEFVESWKKKYG